MYDADILNSCSSEDLDWISKLCFSSHLANFLVCKFFNFLHLNFFYIQEEWRRLLKQKPRADSFNSCVILMLSLSKLLRLWQRITDPKYLSLCHLAANINVKKKLFSLFRPLEDSVPWLAYLSWLCQFLSLSTGKSLLPVPNVMRRFTFLPDNS